MYQQSLILGQDPSTFVVMVVRQTPAPRGVRKVQVETLLEPRKIWKGITNGGFSVHLPQLINHVPATYPWHGTSPDRFEYFRVVINQRRGEESSILRRHQMESSSSVPGVLVVTRCSRGVEHSTVTTAPRHTVPWPCPFRPEFTNNVHFNVAWALNSWWTIRFLRYSHGRSSSKTIERLISLHSFSIKFNWPLVWPAFYMKLPNRFRN